MNVVDVGILVIIGVFAVGGLRRGFMIGFFDLITFALAIIIAARAAASVAAPLLERGLPESIASAAGFFIVLIASSLVLSLASRILLAPLRGFGAGTPLGWVNGVLGLVPGTIRGLAVAALLLMVLMAAPPELGWRSAFTASRLAHPIMETGREALASGLAWAGVDPQILGVIIQPNST
jgi:membrane protein required for colicin V production